MTSLSRRITENPFASPYMKHIVGLDGLSALILQNFQKEENFPHYNIEKISDTEYEITLAVSGYTKENLTITQDNNTLVIEGNQSEDKSTEKVYLHKGISTKRFMRKFTIVDHCNVESSKLENGLLFIRIKRNLPDYLKPKTIPID